MQEIAFQRPQISKFSGGACRRTPRDFSRLQRSNVFTPCFIIYGLTTAFTLKLRGLVIVNTGEKLGEFKHLSEPQS